MINIHALLKVTPSAASRLRGIVPVALLCGGLLLTWMIWNVSQQHAQDKARVVFESQVVKVADVLESQFVSTGLILRGVAGLFAASQSVERDEFQRYVSALSLKDRWPGFLGVGFAEAITPAQLLPHQKAMQAQGFAQYAVWPKGVREAYSAIVYLEPFDARNRRVLGFDMFSEPTRRAAMERARDAGQMRLSGKVRLQQENGEDEQAGMLLYVPVYRNAAVLASVSDRREALVGWVYSPLRMRDFIGRLFEHSFPELSGQIEIELFEGAAEITEHRIYGSEAQVNGAFKSENLVQIAGQSLLLCAISTPDFMVDRNGARGLGFLVAGALLSVALALLAWAFLNSHAKVSAALAQTAQAHRLLSRAQQEMQALFDTSGVAILQIDANGVVVSANQRMAEMFRCNREALVGSQYDKLVPEDERGFVKLRAQALQTGTQTALDIERRYLRADGSEFWGYLSARRLLDQEGNAIGLAGVIADLSDRRAAEQRLRKSELLYRTLTETMQDVVWTLDVASLRFTYCSASVERLRGYLPADVVGSELKQAYVAETAVGFSRKITERAAAFVAGASAPDHYYVDEFPQPCKDGSLVNTEVVSSYFMDEESGRICLRAVSRDISERVRADLERRIAAVAFESREGMVVTDAAGLVIRINRAFTDLTGYGPDEIHGKTLRILHSGRHPASFYEGMWETILADGFWQGQIWNRHKDGHVYPEWLTVTAVKNESGRTTHYVGTAFDISRQVQQQNEISNLAFYDSLTGLANRRLFTDRLCQAFAKSGRSHRFGAVLYIDLDRFKEVNDTLGHSEGDRLLELVADRLTTNVREGDTVARFGGDEFVVLLEDIEIDRERALEIVLEIAEKLRLALHVPYKLHGKMPADWQPSSSIGAAIFRGQQEEMETLMVRADKALYEAKGLGRNAVCLDRGPEKV